MQRSAVILVVAIAVACLATSVASAAPSTTTVSGFVESDCNPDPNVYGSLCDITIQATGANDGAASGIIRFDTLKHPGGIRYRVTEVAFVGSPWNTWCVNGELLPTKDPNWSQLQQALFYFRDEGNGVTSTDLVAPNFVVWGASSERYTCAGLLDIYAQLGFELQFYAVERGDLVVTSRGEE